MGTTDIVVLAICVVIVIAGVVFGYRQSKKTEEADKLSRKNEVKK